MDESVRAYREAETVLVEDPWAFTVSHQQVDLRCSRCLYALNQADNKGSSQPKNRCSRCKYSRYCSRACQELDWKDRHRLECPALKMTATKSPPNHFLLMLKIILKLKSSGHSAAEIPLKSSAERTYYSLISHAEEISQNRELMLYIPQLRKMLGRSLSLESKDMPSVNDILEMFGKIKCNTFEIVTYEQDVSGVGLYLRASAIDHSCEPNACQIFDGTKLTIKATTGVNRFSDVRISYTDYLFPVAVRQSRLLDGYYFTCSCSACTNVEKDAEKFGLCCGRKGCEAVIPSDERADEPCPSCGFVFPPSSFPSTRRVLYQNLLEKIIAQLGHFEKEGPGRCSEAARRVFMKSRDLFNTLMTQLHPTNPLLAHYNTMLGKTILKIAVLDKKHHFSDETMLAQAAQIYRKWLPSVSPLLSWILQQSTTTDLHLTSPEVKLRRCIEMEKVTGLTYGKDHDLYKEAKFALEFSSSMCQSLR